MPVQASNGQAFAAHHIQTSDHYLDADGCQATTGAICFEPVTTHKETHFRQAHAGEIGDFEKVSSYVYVGEGRGKYYKEGVNGGWRFRWEWCLCCCLLPLMLLIPVFFRLVVVNPPAPPVVVIVVTRTATTTTTVRGGNDIIVTPPLPPYDCKYGDSESWKLWIPAHQHYCCDFHDIACPATTTPEPYSCEYVADWQTRWSTKHKFWCCETHNVGCAIPTTTPPDCHDGLSYMWSTRKKDYCCGKFQIGCPTTTKYVPPPPDCHDGLEYEWPTWKSNYCCGKFHIGCPTLPPTPPPIICAGPQAGERQSWSRSKRHYCCHNYHVGCPLPPTTTPLPYNCREGNPKEFSAEKRAWCCQHERIACPSTTTTTNLGCDAQCNTVYGQSGTCRELVQWGASNTFNWRPQACAQSYTEVRVKCPACGGCVFTRLKCVDPATSTSTTTPPLFDCDQDDDAIWTKWTPQKRGYCCSMKQKGCPTTTPEPYNCFDDGHIWNGWSPQKKSYCCNRYHRGCPTRPPTTLAPQYDCGEEFASFQLSWSQDKKNWCCAHDSQKRGCQPKFDCDAGLLTFSISWAAAKKAWCCQNENKGCPGTQDEDLLRRHMRVRDVVLHPGDPGYELYKRQGAGVENIVKGVSTKVIHGEHAIGNDMELIRGLPADVAQETLTKNFIHSGVHNAPILGKLVGGGGYEMSAVMTKGGQIVRSDHYFNSKSKHLVGQKSLLWEHGGIFDLGNLHSVGHTHLIDGKAVNFINDQFVYENGQHATVRYKGQDIHFIDGVAYYPNGQEVDESS